MVSENQVMQLNKIEEQKRKDFDNEGDKKSWSLLGFVFTKLFKGPLQNKSLLKGIFEIFQISGTPPEDEKPKYPAFHDQAEKFDQLSLYYGNLYRGSFVVNYMLGAFAVLLALLPVGFDFEVMFGEEAHLYEELCTVAELCVILLILMIYKIGANNGKGAVVKFGMRRWHERWLEYRELAERFRYLSILYPIEAESQVKLDDSSWVSEYFKAEFERVRKTTGLAVVSDYTEFKMFLKGIMEDQVAYHKKNSHRLEHIHHRVHRIASWLFYLTFIACATHLVFHDRLLTLLAGFLPALAAAFHGILASGEFAKNSMVSEKMAENIAELKEQVDDAHSAEELKTIVGSFHNIVIDDVLGWKTIFKDKNVPLA